MPQFSCISNEIYMRTASCAMPGIKPRLNWDRLVCWWQPCKAAPIALFSPFSTNASSLTLPVCCNRPGRRCFFLVSAAHKSSSLDYARDCRQKEKILESSSICAALSPTMESFKWKGTLLWENFWLARLTFTEWCSLISKYWNLIIVMFKIIGISQLVIISFSMKWQNNASLYWLHLAEEAIDIQLRCHFYFHFSWGFHHILL